MARCTGGAPCPQTGIPHAADPYLCFWPAAAHSSAHSNQVHCKGGLDGRMALEADAAAAAVQTSLTPGWLFPVRTEAVIEKLRAALAKGTHPARLHTILSRARGTGVDSSIIDAAAAQLGPLRARSPRSTPRSQSMPRGSSWRQLARRMNATLAQPTTVF